MAESLRDEKRRLRQIMRERLAAIGPETLEAQSERIRDRAKALPVWLAAEGVFLYWPTPLEPDLRDLIRHALERAKRVALPRHDPATEVYLPAWIEDPDRDLVPGRYGLPEPGPTCPTAPWNQLDLALVPGLAFTVDGRRLGRGRGYYDRMLSVFQGIAGGVCFDEQVVGSVPVEGHDRRLSFVLSPSRSNGGQADVE